MNNLISLITTTLIFYLTGFPYTFLLGLQTLVENLSLSFLVGSGLSTFFWFLAYLLGFPFTISSLLISSLIASLLGFLLAKIFKHKLEFSKLKLEKSEKYLTLAILILGGIALLISAYNPITAWDSLTMYDFRGRVIALDHVLTNLESNAYYLSYPLMTSLSHSIIYLFKGTNPQPLYPLFYLSLISIIFSRLSVWANQKLGLITSLLLLTNQSLWSLSVIAYSNIPYTTLLVASFLYAVSPVSKKDSTHLFISGLLLGLSTWVRSAETFWLIGIFILLWQGIRLKKKLLAFFSLSLVLLFKVTWSHYYLVAYEKLSHPTTPLTSLISLSTITKIINNFSDITYYVSQNIIYPFFGTWLIVLALIPVLLYLFKHKKKSSDVNRIFQLFTIILLSFFMTLGGIALFSTYYKTWDAIGGSAQRMLIFIIPLTIITSIYSYFLTNKN